MNFEKNMAMRAGMPDRGANNDAIRNNNIQQMNRFK